MQTPLKYKIFLTVIFIVSLLPMMMLQYGITGVSGRAGWVNLVNPIGIIATILYLAGIWAPLKWPKLKFFMSLLGAFGIVASEITNFILADSPNSSISLAHSFEYVNPGFYLGLFTSVMLVFIYLCIMSIIKSNANRKTSRR